MKLLLISNSTNSGEAYLEYPKNEILKFLGDKPVKALFIPYAGVTITYNEYAERVRSRFREIGHDIISIHTCSSPVEAVKNAKAIVIGGGNTFMLISALYEYKLIEPIREKVKSGLPFIGWSAGANVACPTICTTNDMPVFQPESFKALNLIPFQINPHYTEASPPGHAGETRQARIEEYIIVNPGIFVIGLREGTMLLIKDEDITLIGSRSAKVFTSGKLPFEVTPGQDLRFLLKEPNDYGS